MAERDAHSAFDLFVELVSIGIIQKNAVIGWNTGANSHTKSLGHPFRRRRVQRLAEK